VRVHVVSDVHGNDAALARAGDGADVLICLGDLILFLDYDDAEGGIFAELFGADAARELIALRTARRFDEARSMSAGLWSTIAGDRRAAIEDAVRAQYARLFAAFPTPTYLTYGNVDLPHLYPDFMRPGLHLLDGQVTEIGGLRVGFVGGGLQTPMRTPFEIPDDEYAAKVQALGEVDVLCSHIPPDVPELCYDVVARRAERGSAAVRELIEQVQPRWALFGHVHNPLVARTRIGRTECVNVGHFRSRGTPYALEWDSSHAAR
jgi:Icc-related predicted phosphoesterase